MQIVAELVSSPRWVEATTERVIARIEVEQPELVTAADLRAATRDSIEANVRLFGSATRRARPAAEVEPPPESVEWSRIAVRHNVGLATLLRTYRIGHEVAFGLWVEALRGRLADPAEVATALEAASGYMFGFVDALSARIAEQYTEERDRYARSAEAVRLETVRALLAEDSTIDPDLASSRLRYPLHRHHLAFVLWHEGPEGREAALPELERIAADAVAPLRLAPMLVTTTGRAVLSGWLASADEVGDVVERVDPGALPPGVRIAFGTPRHGVEGFRASHRQALEAQRVARLHPRPQPVSHYGALALRALATTDLDHARTFVLDELGPLAAPDDATQRLAATLRVYLEEHASPARTAARLGVHPNTVANRVRAAEDLLGRDAGLRVAETLVALQLAPLVAGSAQRSSA